MHWSAEYIGLPWQVGGLTRDGIACWGLARLVYAECLGIPVPDYAAAVPSLEERTEVAAVFAEATSTVGPWAEVDAVDPAEFDVLVFRRVGLAHHVGIAAGPGRMLHIDTDQDSCLVDYTTGKWAPRLVGVYRHKARILDLCAPSITAACIPVGSLCAADGSGGRAPRIVMRQAEPA